MQEAIRYHLVVIVAAVLHQIFTRQVRMEGHIHLAGQPLPVLVKEPCLMDSRQIFHARQVRVGVMNLVLLQRAIQAIPVLAVRWFQQMFHLLQVRVTPTVKFQVRCPWLPSKTVLPFWLLNMVVPVQALLIVVDIAAVAAHHRKNQIGRTSHHIIPLAYCNQ